jgi:flagellin
LNIGYYRFMGVAFGAGQYVAVGGFTDGMGDWNGRPILTSADGIVWTNRTSANVPCLSGIAYGNNRFVAVGRYGTILQSDALSPIQPVLGSPLMLPGGEAELTLAGSAGQSYAIEASTDFIHWQTITNITLTSASGRFNDPSATGFGLRFYRAVAP